jgi:hypothetical protein
VDKGGHIVGRGRVECSVTPCSAHLRPPLPEPRMIGGDSFASEEMGFHVGVL